MSSSEKFVRAQFPRSAAYHPDWIQANGCGANALWLTEWLTADMPLRPGMRVLDLGCGKGMSAVFLAREFGVQVWAVDQGSNVTSSAQRYRDAGLSEQIFPLHCDARSLPFAGEFFDAIVCVDAFMYFGTDALYLNYLAHFVKRGGQLGIANAGLTQELGGTIPPHLKDFWTTDCWCLHSAAWLRNHWEQTGIVDVEVSDAMPDGWRVWLDWQQTAWPTNSEIAVLQADRGQYLSYVRQIARRKPDAVLADYCWPDPLRSGPADYQQTPVLRTSP